MNQSARGLESGECSSAPDTHVTSPTRDCAVWGISAAQRTHKTFELAGKIGKRPVSILLDSGSTGNFVDAQMCTAMGIKVERDQHPEELQMADGTTVQTEGRANPTVVWGLQRNSAGQDISRTTKEDDTGNAMAAEGEPSRYLDPG